MAINNIIKVETIRLIEETNGKLFDIDKIPTEDDGVYQYIYHRGNSSDIIGFKSKEMQEYGKRSKPKSLLELAIIISLGDQFPQKYIDMYIHRKRSLKEVSYINSNLKEILESTYGVIIFNEQINRIIEVIAGFTPSEANTARKIIKSKIFDKMDIVKRAFFFGAKKSEFERIEYEAIWNLIVLYSQFTTSKKKAIELAYESYKLAFLKRFCTPEFQKAVNFSKGIKGDRF